MKFQMPRKYPTPCLEPQNLYKTLQAPELPGPEERIRLFTIDFYIFFDYFYTFIEAKLGCV